MMAWLGKESYIWPSPKSHIWSEAGPGFDSGSPDPELVLLSLASSLKICTKLDVVEFRILGDRRRVTLYWIEEFWKGSKSWRRHSRLSLRLDDRACMSDRAPNLLQFRWVLEFTGDWGSLKNSMRVVCVDLLNQNLGVCGWGICFSKPLQMIPSCVKKKTKILRETQIQYVSMKVILS